MKPFKISGWVLTALILGLCSPPGRIEAGSYLTDPKKMDKNIKLGLDLSTAIMKNKKIEIDLEKIAKDQGEKWMWDSIGGYEKLLTGLGGPSIINTARGKYKEVKGLVDEIEKFSTLLGSGKYDEVAFAAIDKAVGSIKHPVINALWAAIKLTYESHKLVQSTGAALQIESLYGTVQRDRMLLGIQSGDEPAPKQIPVNETTCDYFFNKYIVTNDYVRGEVKQYVKIRLNEDWQSWGEWFSEGLSSLSGVVTGEDASRAAEIERLSTDNRNTARRWIKSLLEDVNKEASVAWAKHKAEKERAAFLEFAKRYEAFGATLEEILKDYNERSKILQESKKYPEFIEQSVKDRTKAETDLNALKPHQVRERKVLYNTSQENTLLCIRYGSRARWIGETKLAERIQEEWNAWSKLRDKISEQISANETRIAADAGAQIVAIEKGDCERHARKEDQDLCLYWKKRADEEAKKEVDAIERSFNCKNASHNEKSKCERDKNEVIQYHYCIQAWVRQMEDKIHDTFLASIVPQFAPHAWTESPDSILKKQLALLNEGKLDEARKLSDQWISDNGTEATFWVGDRLFEGGKALRAKHNQETKDKWIKAGAEAGRELYGLRPSCAALPPLPSGPCTMSFTVCDANYSGECTRSEPLGLGCKAWSTFIEGQQTVYDATKQKLLDTADAFSSLARTLLQQKLELEKAAGQAAAGLPEDPQSILQYLKKEDELLESYKEIDLKRVIAVMKDQKVTLEDLSGFLRWRTKYFVVDTAANADLSGAGVAWEVQETLDKWERARRRWEEFRKDAPLKPEDLDQIHVLVDAGFKARVLDPRDRVVEEIPRVASEVKTRLVAYQKKMETYQNNSTLTATFLEKRAVEWNQWFTPRFKVGTITLQDGVPRVGWPGQWGNMVMLKTPFPHFLSRGEVASFRNQLFPGGLSADVFQFLRTHFPDLYQQVERLASLDGVKIADDENFLHPTANTPFWKGDIAKAAALVAGADAKMAQTEYGQKLEAISKLLPYTLRLGTDLERGQEEQIARVTGRTPPAKVNPDVGELRPVDEKALAFPLGQEYVKVRAGIQKMMDERKTWLATPRPPADQPDPLQPKFDEIVKLAQDTRLDLNADPKRTRGWEQRYWDRLAFARGQYDQLGKKNTAVDAATKGLEDAIKEAVARAKPIDDPNLGAIRDLYQRFKQAYERRDPAAVVSCLGDQWEAGDGTTLSDLQANLSRSARNFDEVRYEIAGLNIMEQPASPGKYLVTYETTITARIFKRNLRHLEKSAVSEEVTVLSNGKPVISRTVGGRFWLVK